MYDTGAKDQ